ncbi:hypothetical protein GALMADRAFT_248681 [Galerina marginata CBS 339.88]|uniref:DUF6533 domain-containing protein n=1 Tax=Galerina marginata (strain CBS 339.88) TaxID=685588 RepID=A0A067T0R5_GALM3|nr:hypothetical protein GALMADRAFT_248681 [Galerina marginata CBS 339.88]
MPLPVPVAFAHLLGNYEFHTSNYVLLLYDHMLTFGEEVEKIWSRPFTLPTLLFYINRYVTHFQYIVIQVAFHETTWTDSVCNRYVRFAGASTTSLVAVGELIMILRVYALYLGNKKILVFLLVLLCGQVSVSAWAVHNGMRVPQPRGFPGCVLTGKNKTFAALWGAPLVTDTCIFFLTVWRAARYLRKHGRMTVMEIMLRDGTLYFLTIFGVNLMNTLIYFLALGDLKAVGASFSQILTSIMISRLQLNLRYTKSDSGVIGLPKMKAMFGYQKTSGPRPETSSSAVFTSVVNTNIRSAETTFFTVGNLGEELHAADDVTDGTESSGAQTVIDESSLELSERRRGWQL